MDIMGTTTAGDAVDSDDLAQPELDEHRFTDRDRAILDFERPWWKYEGAKTTAIRERFGLGPTRYYNRLNWILDQPEALAHDVLTAKRLVKLRTGRRRQRSATARRIDLA